MREPNLDSLELKVGSKYGLVVAVAKRAEQLKDGSRPLVACRSRNPITIALHELSQKGMLVGQGEEMLTEGADVSPEGGGVTADEDLDMDLDIDLDAVLGEGDS